MRVCRLVSPNHHRDLIRQAPAWVLVGTTVATLWQRRPRTLFGRTHDCRSSSGDGIHDLGVSPGLYVAKYAVRMI